MSEMNLPASTQLHQSVPSLPRDVTRLTNRIFPSNGSVFTQNQSIQFDLGNTGLLVPESMSLVFQYQITTTGTATGGTNSYITGTPCYSPFRQLDVQANGSMLSSIANYNQVCHMLSKTRMDLASRASAATSFGISSILTTPSTPTAFENLNGFALPAAPLTSFLSVSQPVVSVLSTADKLLPLFAGPAIRLTFWTCPTTDFVTLGTGQTVAVSLVNISLVYDTVNLGGQYEEMVRSMGPQFTRCTHYATVTQNLAASAAASNIDLVFQARYSSIRAVYLLPSYAGRTYENVFSVTTPGQSGRLTFNFAGIQYPQSGIDLSNSANEFNELRVAAHSSGHSADSFAMAIPSLEYNNMATVVPTILTASPVRPASHYVGTSMEKLGSAGGFLVNGTSSQSAPITVRYTTGGATDAYNISLVAACDCILTFDPQARNITADV